MKWNETKRMYGESSYMGTIMKAVEKADRSGLKKLYLIYPSVVDSFCKYAYEKSAIEFLGLDKEEVLVVS